MQEMQVADSLRKLLVSSVHNVSLFDLYIKLQNVPVQILDE